MKQQYRQMTSGKIENLAHESEAFREEGGRHWSSDGHFQAIVVAAFFRAVGFGVVGGRHRLMTHRCAVKTPQLLRLR